LHIAVFRVVARDNDALVGTAVINLGHTSIIIAVDDALGAGTIRKVEKEVRMRTGRK
jgi:hypothetical protein